MRRSQGTCMAAPRRPGCARKRARVPVRRAPAPPGRGPTSLRAPAGRPARRTAPACTHAQAPVRCCCACKSGPRPPRWLAPGAAHGRHKRGVDAAGTACVPRPCTRSMPHAPRPAAPRSSAAPAGEGEPAAACGADDGVSADTHDGDQQPASSDDGTGTGVGSEWGTKRSPQAGEPPQQPTAPPDASDAQQPPEQPDQQVAAGAVTGSDDSSGSQDARRSAAAARDGAGTAAAVPAAAAARPELRVYLDRLPASVDGCK